MNRPNKIILTAVAAVVCCLILSLPARSETLAISGFAEGCFTNIGCPANTGNVFQGLTFTGGTYDLSGAPTFTLGTLALTRDPVDYAGTEFFLFYVFDDPPGAVFPEFGIEFADVSGNVNGEGTGGVTFTFLNSPQDFDFNGQRFRVRVNDVFVEAGSTVNLTASAVAVPEPTTMLLLGTGLAGLGGVIKRRRHGNKE